MKRNLKLYSINYASDLYDRKGGRTQIIYSDKELKENEFIVVEHIEYGVFIGKVLGEITSNEYKVLEEYTDEDIIKRYEYRYIQDIDLTNYINEKERAKRKEKLLAEMEERFKIIDKEQKFKLYAELDSDFKSMYEEYKTL